MRDRSWLVVLACAAAGCGGGSSGGPEKPWTGPTIRTGFPVVANHAPAPPPYTITCAPFSARAGDTLVAIASAYTFPILQGTSLRWVQRALTRSNVSRERQTALYSAVVPAGGVADERVWFDVPTLQEFGGPDAVPTTPAQLQVFAFDGASGVGAVSWRGNQGATAAPAGLTLEAFSARSLVLVGGAVWDTTTWDAGAGAAVVGAVTSQMGVLVGKTTAAGNVTVQSNATARSWEMVGIEVLPSTATPPTRRFLALGDSGVEGNDSDLPWPVRLGELLGPDWAVYGGGVWWAHSGQTRARWDAQWSAAGPWDVVAVHVGANDVLDHGALDETSWVALVDAISATGTRLLVQTIEATQWYGVQLEADAADDFMRHNLPRHDGVFDFTVLGATALAAASTYLSPDGVHWNDAGNALVAAEYARMVATLAAAPPRGLPVSTAR